MMELCKIKDPPYRWKLKIGRGFSTVTLHLVLRIRGGCLVASRRRNQVHNRRYQFLTMSFSSLKPGYIKSCITYIFHLI